MKNDILPIKTTSKANEAMLSTWWSAQLMKKEARLFFKPWNVSETQFNVLVELYHTKEPITQQKLSQRLLVDKSNITGLLDRLEKEKLVQRKKVASDRRRYHIVLTKQGLELIKELDQEYDEKVISLMESFSDEELSELIRLNRKLIANLKLV